MLEICCFLPRHAALLNTQICAIFLYSESNKQLNKICAIPNIKIDSLFFVKRELKHLECFGMFWNVLECLKSIVQLILAVVQQR